MFATHSGCYAEQLVKLVKQIDVVDIDTVADVACVVADAASALNYLFVTYLINPILTFSYSLYSLIYYMLFYHLLFLFLHYILPLVGMSPILFVRPTFPLGQSVALFVPLPSLLEFSFLGG